MKYPGNIMKSKAYLIIVGAFCIGLITGSLLMNLVIASAPGTKKMSIADELSIYLKLTPQQKLQVEDAYKESKRQGKELFKTIQPQMDQINKQTKEKVKLILTPEQSSSYEGWCNNKEQAKKAVSNEQRSK